MLLLCMHDVEKKTVMVRSMISLNIVNILFILFSYCRCVLRDPLSISSITVFIQLDFARAKFIQMQDWCSPYMQWSSLFSCYSTLAFFCIEFCKTLFLILDCFQLLWRKPLHFRSWLCLHRQGQNFPMEPF